MCGLMNPNGTPMGITYELSDHAHLLAPDSAAPQSRCLRPTTIQLRRVSESDFSPRAGGARRLTTALDRVGGRAMLSNSVAGTCAASRGAVWLTDATWQGEFELNLFAAGRLARGLLPATLPHGCGVIFSL